jgi:hypothetical protein
MTNNNKLIISGISVCILIAGLSYYAGTKREPVVTNQVSSSTEETVTDTSSPEVKNDPKTTTTSTSGTKLLKYL